MARRIGMGFLMTAYVLAAGCAAVAQDAAGGQPLPAMSEARTPTEWLALHMAGLRRSQAEWLEIVRDPQEFRAWCSKGGDELDYLKRCFVLMYESNIRMVGESITDNPKRRECVQHFVDWMKQRGDAMLERLVSGRGLAPDEQRYQMLLKAVAIWRAGRGLKMGCRGFPDLIPSKKSEEFSELDKATVRYVAKLYSGVNTALRKGYLAEKLTPADIEALRIPCMSGHITNFGNKIHFAGDARMMPYSLPSGAEVKRDYRFLKMEHVLARPDYCDEFPHNPLIVFEPEVVIDALCRFPDWTAATDEKGNRFTVPAPLPPVEQDGDRYVRLSQFRGKTAVAYVAADSADDCWTDIKWSAYEGLYQAYKEHVEFFFLDVTIGESALSAQNYFGPPTDYSCLGAVGKELCGHAYTHEEHARTAKLHYMTHPFVTYPTVLDTLGNTFHYSTGRLTGGAASFQMIGKDGRIMHALTFPGQVGIGFGYHGQILNINAAERMLHAVVANDGRFDTTLLPLMEGGWLIARSGGGRGGKGSGYVVKTIDPQKRRIMTTKPPVGYYLGDGSPRDEVAFHYDDETVFLEYKTARPVPASYVQPGDTLGVLGVRNKEDTEIRARVIYVPEREGRRVGYVGPSLRYWLSSRIKSVGPGGRTITVEPVLEVDQMKGYGYWQQAGNMATAYGAARENLDRLAKDLSHDRTSAVFVLKLREDTDVFLNANWAVVEDLQEGDFAHVAYDPQQLELADPPVVCIRATRLEPMEEVKADTDNPEGD